MQRNMEGEAPSKKLRKPYTITRPRDRWTSEEHDRFLEALLLYNPSLHSLFLSFFEFIGSGQGCKFLALR